jgi:7-carboxy-7-deazaguanine synthase
MTYSVKELFYTLQGEGAQAGRAAVFCRFAGCNLWSGREVDRLKAVCKFCDTEFVGTDGTGNVGLASTEQVAGATTFARPPPLTSSPSCAPPAQRRRGLLQQG